MIHICLVPFIYSVYYLFVILGLYLFIYFFTFISSHRVDALRTPVRDCYQLVTSYGCSRDIYDGMITLYTVVFVFLIAFLFL